MRVDEAAREVCIVVLRGTVTCGCRTAGLARRSASATACSMTPRRPPSICRRGVAATVTALDSAEIGVATRAGRRQVSGAADRAGRDETLGARRARNTRYVCDVLPRDRAGRASARGRGAHALGAFVDRYPPHKHDQDAVPAESFLEETYYHRLNPPQGFAFQRVYTDDRSIDESYAVEDWDVVMVPRGYHPVVVPYGYESYYLNVMAGPKRAWRFKNDPAHEWILQQK